MANYPDWVLKHKRKGTYINYQNGKYYLYAAHSERVPGTNKVKRICDGYLGRITEEDGLIPSKDKVAGDVEVFEYGRSSAILQLCQNIYTGFKRKYKRNGADFIMAASILSVIYGEYSNSLFKQSFLSIKFQNIDLDIKVTEKQQIDIERGVLMIKDKLSNIFKNQYLHVMNHLSTVYKVKINQKFYLSKESNNVGTIKNNYQINWED